MAPRAAFAVRHTRPVAAFTRPDLRRSLVQIGHQDFRLVRADVTPLFTQHPCDVADVPQTQACAKTPQAFAALCSRKPGHAEALKICVRDMGHQVFECFPIHGFPRACYGEDKAPALGGLLHACDDDPRGPGRWNKVARQRTSQGLQGFLDPLRH